MKESVVEFLSFEVKLYWLMRYFIMSIRGEVELLKLFENAEKKEG